VTTKYEGRIIHSQHDYCDGCPAFDEETFLKIENDRSFIYLEGNQRFRTLPQKTVYYLNQISTICKKKGIDLLIVLIPDELQVNSQLQKAVREKFYPDLEEDAWNTTLPNEKLTAALEKLKIDHIDLYKYFAEKPTEQLYRPRDTHWNIAGNMLAANILQNYLLNQYRDRMK
jgi:RNase H-fold protein (predicted Holliday junction resolvase)